MDADNQNQIALAAKNWRETEKKVLEAKGKNEHSVSAISNHHHAKIILRQAVDKALNQENGR